MLLDLLMNLGMYDSGGPLPINPQGGGGTPERHSQIEDQNALRKKILDQDDEDVMLFIHNFIVTQNSNG